MLDDPMTIAAAYVAGSAALSTAIAKFSPTIGPRMRHLLAGAAPIVAVFAFLLEGSESVTLHGPDLLAGAGMFVGGLAASISVDRLRKDGRRRAIEA